MLTIVRTMSCRQAIYRITQYLLAIYSPQRCKELLGGGMGSIRKGNRKPPRHFRTNVTSRRVTDVTGNGSLRVRRFGRASRDGGVKSIREAAGGLHLPHQGATLLVVRSGDWAHRN